MSALTTKTYEHPQLVNVGGRWYIAYHDELGRGRKLSTFTHDYAEALRRMARWIETGSVRGELQAATLGEVLTAYSIEKASAAASINVLPYRIARLQRILGDVGIPYDPEHARQTLEAAYLDYQAQRLSEGIAPSTIKADLTIMSAAVRWAQKMGRLPMFAITNIVGSPEERQKEKILTPEQLKALMKAAKETYGHEDRTKLSRAYRFVMMAYWCGARFSSIVNLRWSDICLENGREYVNFRPYYAGTKRKRGAIVPISTPLLAVVKKAYEERTTSYYLTNTAHMRTVLRNAFEAAGLKGFTPHCLRHTRATALLAAGATPTQVAALLGNSPGVLMENYNHLDRDVARSRELLRSLGEIEG